MDIKIELTSLFAIYLASTQINHAISVNHSDWREFPPTRFIYSFFLFNRIYSFDWETSLNEGKLLAWMPDEKGNYPKEDVQIKNYLIFVKENLKDKLPKLFSSKLNQIINLFGVEEPMIYLDNISKKNLTRKQKSWADQFPKRFEKIYKGSEKLEDFHSDICSLIRFIYKVRSNIFHGSKSFIEMASEQQQKRLLIYSALLISANSIIFQIAENELGWVAHEIDFTKVNVEDESKN